MMAARLAFATTLTSVTATALMRIVPRPAMLATRSFGMTVLWGTVLAMMTMPASSVFHREPTRVKQLEPLSVCVL